MYFVGANFIGFSDTVDWYLYAWCVTFETVEKCLVTRMPHDSMSMSRVTYNKIQKMLQTIFSNFHVANYSDNK